MYKLVLVAGFSIFSLQVLAQAKAKTIQKPPVKKEVPKEISLKNEVDSLSYAFGISVGNFLKAQGFEKINGVALVKAVEQTIKNEKPLFDENQANQIIQKITQKKMSKVSQAEVEKGKKFLAENKNKPGVIETASGLQYEILVKGDGPIPTINDVVSAHYKGSLLDGKEFDNSYNRGKPLEIPVSGVIKGWTEALQLMPVGSKWKLYIPSELGYGDNGAGSAIPGGATLIFEVELLGIQSK